MNYFTDTNIPLGYTVIHDRWHVESTDFILKNQNKIFWSNLVQEEYSNKLSYITHDVERFLKRTTLILKKNEKAFVNYGEFEEIILEETKHVNLDEFKKRKILENFWNNYNFTYENPKTFYNIFKEYYSDFQKIYFDRDNELSHLLILHDCGLKNYLKYLNYANQLFEWGIHKPDCKIITDAHDCGLAHENLIFISNDEKMLNIISNHDTSFLKIMEFRSCT